MKYLIPILLTLTLFSCKDEDMTLCGSSDCYTDGVFILNEGLFQNANASVTFYDPESNTSEQDIFFTNNLIRIGDILYSGTFYKDDLYLIVNNSSKIVRVNPSTFQIEESIPINGSPRRMLVVSDEKAYVTDLFGGIHVLDLSTSTVTNEIPQSGWTEEMILLNGYAYICKSYFDSRKSQLLKIDVASDIIVDSLMLRPGGRSIVQDMNDNFWVLCSGDTAAEDTSSVIQIDPAGLSIMKSIGITDKTEFGGPSELGIDPAGQMLYYLNAGLYKLSVMDNQQPVSPFISSDSRNFYDFSVDSLTGEIYICDAIDFVQKGRVYRYDNTGILIDDFETGIAPGEIIFH